MKHLMQFSSLRHAACAVLLLLAVGILHPSSAGHGSANRRLLAISRRGFITKTKAIETTGKHYRYVDTEAGTKKYEIGPLWNTQIFKCTTCKDTGVVGWISSSKCTKCNGEGWQMPLLPSNVSLESNEDSYDPVYRGGLLAELDAERYTGRNLWTAGILSQWATENYKLYGDGTLVVNDGIHSYQVRRQDDVTIIDNKELKFKVTPFIDTIVPEGRIRHTEWYLRCNNDVEALKWKKALSIINLSARGNGQLKYEKDHAGFGGFRWRAWKDRQFVGECGCFGFINETKYDEWAGITNTKIQSVTEEPQPAQKYKKYGNTRFLIKYEPNEVATGSSWPSGQRPDSRVRFEKGAELKEWRDYFKPHMVKAESTTTTVKNESTTNTVKPERRRVAATPRTLSRLVVETKRASRAI